MKNLFSILVLLLFVQSCDNPQRTRNPYGQTLPSSIPGSPGVNFTTPPTSGNNNNNNSNFVPTQNPTNGFENCNLGYQYYGTSIGSFGVCQNSQIESSFKIKLATTDSVEGTCFIPLSVQSSGTSFKLGIAECVRSEANREYDMTLTKERSEPITGVMVIKYTALGPYMDCMNAKVTFINSYANCSFDPSCLSTADSYAAGICNQFSQTYKNYYYQVTLPARIL